MTQDLLLEQVWGTDYLGESHMLQVNINRLRRKIEDDHTHPCYLLTKVALAICWLSSRARRAVVVCEAAKKCGPSEGALPSVFGQQGQGGRNEGSAG